MTTATTSELARVRDRIYATSRATGESGRTFNPFPTAMAEDAGAVLRHLAEREGATRTIETGLAFGLSALFLLDGSLSACDRDAGETPHHVAIDPFQESDWDNAGLRAIRESGVQHLVEFLPEDSLLALPRLVAEGRSFDLGFVDGGHHFENAFIDVYYLHRLVKPGGLIIIDDLWMPAIQAVVSYFVRNFGSVRESLDSHPAARRFAVLRTPVRAPVRPWDHFVDFRDTPDSTSTSSGSR